jgi:hypothetical protein
MITIRYMALIAVWLVGLNGLATADVITDWNEKAVAAGYTARVSPGLSARNIAMVHLAMFEALNSIEPRYGPYRTRLPVEPGASPDAAAAAAAHYLLARMYPDQAKEMESRSRHRSTLSRMARRRRKASGSANRRPLRYLQNATRTARMRRIPNALLLARADTFPCSR